MVFLLSQPGCLIIDIEIFWQTCLLDSNLFTSSNISLSFPNDTYIFFRFFARVVIIDILFNQEVGEGHVIGRELCGGMI